MNNKSNKWKMSIFSMAFKFFALSTSIIAAVIILLNTYSPLQSNKVLDEALKNSKELSESLYDIQERYNESAEVIVRYLPNVIDPFTDRDYLQRLASMIQAVSTDFVNQRTLCHGYFYNINAQTDVTGMHVYHDIRTDIKSHISMIFGYKPVAELKAIEAELKSTERPVWTTVNQPMHNKYYLICVVPLFSNDAYLGYIGLVLDSDAFKEKYPELLSSKWRYSFLLTKKNEIMAHDEFASGGRLEYVGSKLYAPLAEAIGNADSGTALIKNTDGYVWIYAFDRMPSGQIYVEAQQRFHRVVGVNLLIFQITLMAIIATSLIHKWRKDENTFFGWISDHILTHSRDAHPLIANSRRAVLSLHIGCIGGMASYLLFLFLTGAQTTQKVFYIAILIALLLAFQSYKSNMRTIRKLVTLGFIMLVLPILMQLLSVELGVGNLIWILVTIVGALFLTGVEDARYVFYSFVIALFLYALIEIFFFGHSMPQTLMPIIGSLFFLGFALFSSVGVYVSSSENDYVKLENALEQLKNAESLIIQREKMVTLGRLVAGVAHEINTPMGAIKASVETINASLERIFRLVMEQGSAFDDHDRDDFFKLMSAFVMSISEMNTTMQMRKARPGIRALVKELVPDDDGTIADSLIRLEICNLDLIRANSEVFNNPRIGEMLKLLCNLTPLVSGSQTIMYAVSRASKIIFALRSYSHYSTSGDLEKFDIAQSIENVLTLYYNQIKQNIVLIRNFEDLPNVFGSADEISQVWTNLIHNSMQAMPGGGTLTVSTLNTCDGYIEVSFADTGSGIPPDLMEKIFEPFYTTKPLGEGSGLGLDISRKIIENHKGIISVQSEPGYGSTFTVRLPIGGDSPAEVTGDMG